MAFDCEYSVAISFYQEILGMWFIHVEANRHSPFIPKVTSKYI